MADAVQAMDIDSEPGQSVTLEAASMFNVFLNKAVTVGLSDQECHALKVF